MAIEPETNVASCPRVHDNRSDPSPDCKRQASELQPESQEKQWFVHSHHEGRRLRRRSETRFSARNPIKTVCEINDVRSKPVSLHAEQIGSNRPHSCGRCNLETGMKPGGGQANSHVTRARCRGAKPEQEQRERNCAAARTTEDGLLAPHARVSFRFAASISHG